MITGEVAKTVADKYDFPQNSIVLHYPHHMSEGVEQHMDRFHALTASAVEDMVSSVLVKSLIDLLCF